MPKSIETEEYTIGSHFLPALINGDITGLDDEDEELLAAFTFEAVGFRDGHWSVPEDAEPEFAMCEITGFMSECQTIEYVTIKEQ